MRFTLVIAIWLATFDGADANLVQNGSFEDYTVPQSQWSIPGVVDHDVPVGSVDIVGWEVINGTLDYVTGWQAAAGDASLDLGGDPGEGGVRQNIPTDVGTVYNLNFMMSGNPDNFGEATQKMLRVEVAGTCESFVFDTAAAGNTFTDMKWQPMHVGFHAIANSTDLVLLNTMGTVFTGPVVDQVSVTVRPTCDFDGNAVCDIDDLNGLLSVGPINDDVDVVPGQNDHFDMSGDTIINLLDRDIWLEDAARLINLPSAYKLGDANLDGTVDGQDFLAWNGSKFTDTLQWDQGDFNGDGINNGQDFIIWNGNKFSSSDLTAVPEPVFTISLLMLLIVSMRHRRL